MAVGFDMCWAKIKGYIFLEKLREGKQENVFSLTARNFIVLRLTFSNFGGLLLRWCVFKPVRVLANSRLSENVYTY